jgi:hypothetical protein
LNQDSNGTIEFSSFEAAKGKPRPFLDVYSKVSAIFAFGGNSESKNFEPVFLRKGFEMQNIGSFSLSKIERHLKETGGKIASTEWKISSPGKGAIDRHSLSRFLLKKGYSGFGMPVGFGNYQQFFAKDLDGTHSAEIDNLRKFSSFPAIVGRNIMMVGIPIRFGNAKKTK